MIVSRCILKFVTPVFLVYLNISKKDTSIFPNSSQRDERKLSNHKIRYNTHVGRERQLDGTYPRRLVCTTTRSV